MRGDRLQIGEYGEIRYREGPGGVTATFYYRNRQGRRRRLEAPSRSAAKRKALAALELVLDGVGDEQYSARTTFAMVAEEWHRQFVDLVATGRRSPSTAALYRHALDRHVLPELGGLRLNEVTTARLDHFIHRVRRVRGYSVAKLCRSIVSGVCGLAVRRDAMRSNPVRDVGRLEGQDRVARALTPEECAQWLAIVDADGFACARDLPDLTRFLLGTGVRLGEALGVCWDDVDLETRSGR